MGCDVYSRIHCSCLHCLFFFFWKIMFALSCDIRIPSMRPAWAYYTCGKQSVFPLCMCESFFLCLHTYVRADILSCVPAVSCTRYSWEERSGVFLSWIQSTSESIRTGHRYGKMQRRHALSQKWAVRVSSLDHIYRRIDLQVYELHLLYFGHSVGTRQQVTWVAAEHWTH